MSGFEAEGGGLVGGDVFLRIDLGPILLRQLSSPWHVLKLLVVLVSWCEMDGGVCGAEGWFQSSPRRFVRALTYCPLW